MTPRGETMLGMGRTLSGDAVVEWEHTRIEARADGVVFVALPSGQAEATFRLAETRDGAATFENLGHDFPKHVRYEARGAELVARIWGDEPAKAIEWRYVKE